MRGRVLKGSSWDDALSINWFIVPSLLLSLLHSRFPLLPLVPSVTITAFKIFPFLPLFNCMMAKDKTPKASARSSPVIPKNGRASRSGSMCVVGDVKLPKGKRRETWPGFGWENDEALHEGRSSDIIIPVIGKTGIGKSTFINTLLGEDAMRAKTKTISYALMDPEVIASRHPNLAGRRVYIVDTPGFDSDVDTTLKRIRTWVDKSYWKGMELGGYIYLHHICERLSGGTLNRLEEEEEQFMIATTGWDEIVDAETGDGLSVALNREKELTNVAGEDVKRFWMTKGSAGEILNIILLAQRRKGVPLKRFKSVWTPSVLV